MCFVQNWGGQFYFRTQVPNGSAKANIRSRHQVGAVEKIKGPLDEFFSCPYKARKASWRVRSQFVLLCLLRSTKPQIGYKQYDGEDYESAYIICNSHYTARVKSAIQEIRVLTWSLGFKSLSKTPVVLFVPLWKAL